MNINIHIERLILDGVDVPYAQRPVLQAALESELARLVGEGGIAPGLASGGAFPRVRVPGAGITISSEGGPAALGQQIAQAVYGGIGDGGI
jgi:hypothetical protein